MWDKLKIRKELLISLLVSTILVISLVAFASNKSKNVEKSNIAASAENKVEKQKQEQTEKRRKQILSEAQSAIRETENALKALDEGKSDDAISALERATGKLEIILARDPSLKLASVGVNVVTYNLLSNINSVKLIREKALHLLKNGRVQEARHLLKNLASETVIRVTNIPLATYPDAIKNAVALLDDGKSKEAKAVLQTALSTLVVVDKIIPIPVATSQALLQEAKTLSEKKDRRDKENARLKDLISEARTELEYAQALGYGKKKDFSDLYKELDIISEKTKDGSYGIGFFKPIESLLSNLVDSNQPVESKGSSQIQAAKK